MAYSVALKRAINSSGLLKRAIPSATVTRCFNSNAQMERYEDDQTHPNAVSRRRHSFPTFFSDAFDPFSPPRSVNQLMNLMDQMMENPLVAASRGIGAGAGTRRGWDVKEDSDALYLRMDMPGLDKENVKVSVEETTLIIKGEGQKESEEEEYGRRYSSRLDLTPNMYKIDGIKAEMKNGVLKVMVPKVKEEERKDVREVKIQ
ncbi:hypothetical protein LIER_35598 [Lithospermum erythrorhizon]|uniref:SHSP domain-containing protein n=1 Tax=Lithospermum erythrorhizon TaxID=34254 RepID=A0AAV3NT55_LITER